MGSAGVAVFDGGDGPAPTCRHCNDPPVVVVNFMKHVINPEAVRLYHQSPQNFFLEDFLFF